METREGEDSQRFQYGFISNMPCDSCNNNREDVRHYIFFCPAFAAQRQALIEGLTALLPTAVMQNKQSLMNISLYGSDNFPEDTNFNIFSPLQAYRSSSVSEYITQQKSHSRITLW